MKSVTSEQMRALDQETIEVYGIPGLVLMENAGRSISDLLVKKYPKYRKVLVLCGAGNNGGDGFVVARHLHNLGMTVRVCFIGAAENLKGDASINYLATQKMNIVFISMEQLNEALEQSDVIVDALFGVGLTRDVEGDHKKAIQAVNKSKKPVVAIDTPSGLDSDSGNVKGEAIRAKVTGTLAIAKKGLLTKKARPYVGQLHVLDISIPKDLIDGTV